jgi:2-C-methyl-D-erythritol 2,4-cyclodiphosphate synthase
LLGAAALGDIGTHFPDTDKWRGADRKVLLRGVGEMSENAGYRIENIDATVALQRPKLRPLIDAMRTTMAEVLELEVGQVSVKATTTEKLGSVGTEAGAAVLAVCLLDRL